MYDSKLNRILALTTENKVLDGSNYGQTEGTNVWVSACVFYRTCHCTAMFYRPTPAPNPGMGLAEWTKPEGAVRTMSKK